MNKKKLKKKSKKTNNKKRDPSFCDFRVGRGGQRNSFFGGPYFTTLQKKHFPINRHIPGEKQGQFIFGVDVSANGFILTICKMKHVHYHLTTKPLPIHI